MIWQYILTFILFIVCLSVLIMIHELGHLTAAKIFKVYCFDYSIGFGPALLHKKRKNGETYFSIRAIPFGGFVSMYGEKDENLELPDGIESIPEERSLAKIKAWKRAIVLVAGVTLNAILALVLFFVSNCLPQQQLYLRYIDVEENSVAYNAGLTSESILYYEMPKEYTKEETVGHEKDYVYDADSGSYYKTDDPNYLALGAGYFILDKTTTVTYLDNTTKTIGTTIDGSGDSKLSFKIRDYDTIIKYFHIGEDNLINFAKPVDFKSEGIASITVNLKTVKYEGDSTKPVLTGDTYQLVLNNNQGKLDSYGIKMKLVTKRLNFGQNISKTFTDFGESSVLIFKTIGGLFIGRGWNQVGGIVAIYNQSSQIFMNYNASLFIYLWALISVNLAVFNLLPFPGLDGWQLLVLFVEKVFKKEIPQKVKSIISFVGMILLFTFMILIIVKDVIGLF